jgi:hypothetical protein
VPARRNARTRSHQAICSKRANSGDKQVGVDDLMTQFTAEDMIETSKIIAAKRQRPALAEKDKT